MVFRIFHIQYAVDHLSLGHYSEISAIITILILNTLKRRMKKYSDFENLVNKDFCYYSLNVYQHWLSRATFFMRHLYL